MKLMLPSLTLVHFFLSLFNCIIPYITRAIHNLPFSKLSRASQGLTLETTWHLALETPSVTRADSLLVFNEQNLSS